MLKLVRHSELSSFSQSTLPYLNQDEVTHNLILGVTARFLAAGRNMDFLAHVEDGSGRIVAVAMRTAENTSAVLSNIEDEAAIPLLVDAFAQAFDRLPGAMGRPEEASRFAELWQQAKGQNYHTKMEQGIYRLDTLIPPRAVSGKARRGTKDDFDFLTQWIQEFDVDTGLREVTPQIAAEIAERKLAGDFFDSVWFWEDENKIVSMAGIGRQTENGAGIGLVYTPAERRGHGYASAITAAASQAILDAGKKFCFLYTDLGFPTSNKIYQAIGYRHLNNHRLIAFE